jgi:type II secretory pathway component GspD/PulD (secretin)
MNKNVFLSLFFVLLVVIFSSQALAKEKLTDSAQKIKPINEQLITLNYRDMDIRNAFSALAMEFKLNIVMSNDVQGNITLHLFGLPLEDALSTIALAGGYEYKNDKGLHHIYKASAEEKKIVPVPIETQMKVFKTNFVAVAKVKETLAAVPGLNSIEVHEGTKTIIVNDTLENIKKIEKILSFLDSVPKQVLIEAKILKVTLNDDMTFGVDWKAIMTDGIIQTSGLSTAVLPAGVDPIGNTRTNPVSGIGTFANFVAGAGRSSQIALAIDALKSKTKVDTVATPKVLAIHGKEAKVQVGGQQGYKVRTIEEAGAITESIKFIDTGTILEITPFIDENDNILLNVKPSINSATIDNTGIPSVTSTTVSTWLLAKDGETAFIAGLIESTKTKKKLGIPILGDLPLLSYLFSRTEDINVKDELVILITPKIIKNNLSLSPKQ